MTPYANFNENIENIFTNTIIRENIFNKSNKINQIR